MFNLSVTKKIVLTIFTAFPQISSPRRLFRFEALRCETYGSVALKRVRDLFQSQRNYTHQISKTLVIFSFQIEIIITMIYSLIYSRTTSYSQVFIDHILVPYAF